MRICVLLGALALSTVASAQSYDSTGASRLWGENPSTPSELVPVPEHGSYAIGAVVKAYNWMYFDNGGSGKTEYGVCTARQGGPGFTGLDYAHPYGYKKLCPTNTDKVRIYESSYSTSNGGG